MDGDTLCDCETDVGVGYYIFKIIYTDKFSIFKLENLNKKN